jgi:hypothetical protein
VQVYDTAEWFTGRLYSMEKCTQLIVYFVYYVDNGDDIPSFFDVEVDYIC